MKRGLMMLLVAVLPVSGLFAQDAVAKQILAQVSKKYRSYSSIKATFALTIELPQREKQVQKGVLLTRPKTGEYRLTLPEQELISDGKTVWTYLKEDNEVQLSDADNTSGSITPATILTVYETGYKYLYTGDAKMGGRTVQQIELTPLDAKNHYFKIRLSIDKLLHQVKSALVYDKNGSKYTYTISAFVPGAAIPAGMFTFDRKKYPGVTLEDLR